MSRPYVNRDRDVAAARKEFWKRKAAEAEDLLTRYPDAYEVR